MKKIQTSNAPQAIGPYSQAIEVGNFIYTSGQIALTPNGEFLDDDVVAQTHQVCKNLQEVLKEAGCELKDVVKTTIFLADMEHFTQMNEVYATYFAHKPARSTVAVKTLPKDALVEIECIAIKK